MNEDEEGPFVVEIEQPPQVSYDDTATYAQTLSNTVLALVQWESVDAEERLFVRMQIKRLIDGQLALKELYLPNEEDLPNEQESAGVVEAPAPLQ